MSTKFMEFTDRSEGLFVLDVSKIVYIKPSSNNRHCVLYFESTNLAVQISYEELKAKLGLIEEDKRREWKEEMAFLGYEAVNT